MSYFKQDNDMIKLSWELQNNVGRRWGIIPNEADLIEQHHFYNQYTGAEVGTGEGNGTPFQYSCLENPMDGGAW